MITTLVTIALIQMIPLINGVTFVVDDPTKGFSEKKYALMDFYGNILTEFDDNKFRWTHHHGLGKI